MAENLIVYTDGGARGNPGPAAIGIYITDAENQMILKKGERIGKTTNNTAEYLAVIGALQWIKNNFKKEIQSIKFFLDSNLVVNQLNGIFKVKQGHLRELLFQVRQLEQTLGVGISYNFIPREKNKIADFLVNNSF